ncbi:hypothetical protein [Billgrantia lactosivorans]|uniref:hypothetical protein n=1 Tax=Billgrantia lactosivorans TaxID=2185141 RepID=UPI000DAC8E0E|nr:hypothetical protein [Halomonas lactosivorans]
MTTEPQRLQYLEAMGLTAWVARYRLPHARPTEACEWELPERPAASPPAERLHALLDEADAAARQPPPTPSAVEPPRGASPKRARQLLGIAPDSEAPTSGGGTTPAPSSPAQEPLRFTLQVTSLAGRWLVIVPRSAAPEAAEAQLLGNLLQAAGIGIETPLTFETFRWPPMDNLPVEAPLEEAREGLQAFLEGTRRRGWALERILVFGQEATLDRLLDATQGDFELMGLAGWQGPALGELAQSAAAKRELWPTLLAWRRAWTLQAADGD